MPTMADNKIEALYTMFKGEPGLRKSTEALSYPTPQYWVSTDQKMEALNLPMKRWGVKPTDVHYHDYTDWEAPRSYLEKLQVNCPFRTIIIDSVLSMGDAMTRQVRKMKKGEGQGKTIGGIPVSGLEEFNAESAAFTELVAITKDIHKYHKVNVILIAHVIGQRKDNDANKLTHHSRIIATGAEKISAKLAAYMTEVYHFNIEAKFEADKEGDYGLMTVHTGNDYARTSLPLPGKITFNNDPLYEKWIKPAIDRLNAEKPIERIPLPQQTQTTTQPPNPNLSPFTPIK